MSNFTVVDLLNQSPNVIITGGLNPTGAYNAITAYAKGDSVSYNGSSYVAIAATTGNLPTNATFWQLISAGNTRTYTQAFTLVSSVAVPHNLGKYPAIQIVDSALSQCEGAVIHTDINNLTISFSASFSGTVICN